MSFNSTDAKPIVRARLPGCTLDADSGESEKKYHAAGCLDPVENVLYMLLGHESNLFALIKQSDHSQLSTEPDSADGFDESDANCMDYARFYILHNNYSKSQNKLIKWFADLGNIMHDCRSILYDDNRSIILSEKNENCVAREVYSSSLDLLNSIEGELSAILNEEFPNSRVKNLRSLIPRNVPSSKLNTLQPLKADTFDSHSSAPPTSGQIRLISLFRRCRSWVDLLKASRDLLVSCQFDRSGAVDRNAAAKAQPIYNSAESDDIVNMTSLRDVTDLNASFGSLTSIDLSSPFAYAAYIPASRNITTEQARTSKTIESWNKIVLDALYRYHDLLAKLSLPEKLTEVFIKDKAKISRFVGNSDKSNHSGLNSDINNNIIDTDQSLKLWLVNDTSMQIVDYFISRLHSATSIAYLKTIFSGVFSHKSLSSHAAATSGSRSVASPFISKSMSPASMELLFSCLHAVKGDLIYLQKLPLSTVNLDNFMDETKNGNSSINILSSESVNTHKKDVEYSYLQDFQMHKLDGVIDKSFLTMFDEKSYYKSNKGLLDVMQSYKPYLTGRSFHALRQGLASDRSRLAASQSTSFGGISVSGESRLMPLSKAEWSVHAESIVEAKAMVQCGAPASTAVHLRRTSTTAAGGSKAAYSLTSATPDKDFNDEFEERLKFGHNGRDNLQSKRLKPFSIANTLNKRFNTFVKNDKSKEEIIKNSSELSSNVSLFMIKNDENDYKQIGIVSVDDDSECKNGYQDSPIYPAVAGTVNLFSHWVSLNIKFRAFTMSPLTRALKSVSSHAVLMYLKDNEIIRWLRFFQRVFLMIDGNRGSFKNASSTKSSGVYNFNSDRPQRDFNAVYSYEIWEPLRESIDNLVWRGEMLVIDNIDSLHGNKGEPDLSSSISSLGTINSLSSINSNTTDKHTINSTVMGRGIAHIISQIDNYLIMSGNNLASISHIITERLKGLRSLHKGIGSSSRRLGKGRIGGLTSTPVKTPSPAKYNKISPNVANVDSRISSPSSIRSSSPSIKLSPQKSTSSSRPPESTDTDCQFFINTVSPMRAVHSLISNYSINMDKVASLTLGMHAFSEFLCSTLTAGTIVHSPLSEVISQNCIAMYSILHHYVIRMMSLKWAADSLWKKIMSSSLPVRIASDTHLSKVSGSSHCFSLYSLSDNLIIANIYLDLNPPPPPQLGASTSRHFMPDHQQINDALEIETMLTEANLDHNIKCVRAGVSLLYHIVRYSQEKLFSIIQDELSDPLISKFDEIVKHLTEFEEGGDNSNGLAEKSSTPSSYNNNSGFPDFSLYKLKKIHEECLSNAVTRVTTFFPERLSDIYTSYSKEFTESRDNLLSRILFHCWEVIDSIKELTYYAKQLGLLSAYLDFKQRQQDEQKKKTTNTNFGIGSRLMGNYASSNARVGNNTVDKSIISDRNTSKAIIKKYFESLRASEILCGELQRMYQAGKSSIFDSAVEEENNRIRGYAKEDST